MSGGYRIVVSLWGVIVFLALSAPVYGDSLAGDTDRDGDVDFTDFLALASNFGRTDGDAGGTTIETISVYPWGEAVGPDRVDGEILIASWNVRIFSTGSRDDAELGLIADRLQQFDLIAIQELRDEEVVQRTLATLGERGLPYQAIVSDEVGRTTTERYAFIFRSDRVEALDLGAFFDDVSDDFIREPFYVDCTTSVSTGTYPDLASEARSARGRSVPAPAWCNSAPSAGIVSLAAGLRRCQLG